MSDGSERRRHERHNVALNVRLASGDHRFEVLTDNVSIGGIFVETQHKFGAVNDQVDLEIVLPEASHGRDRKLPVRATVLYAIEGKGYGLEFSWWEEGEQAVRDELHAWLESEGLLDTTLDDDVDLGAGSMTTASQIDGAPIED